MTDFIGKKYKLESSEHFEEYLKAIGVKKVDKKAGKSNLSLQLLEKDGTFTMRVSSTLKKKDLKFKIGEEIDEVTESKTKVKSVIKLDNDKMIHVQKYADKEVHIERHFSDTQLVVVIKVGDVTCTRKFKFVK